MERNLRTRLRGMLPGELLRTVPRAFDIIGSKQRAVAVVEIPEELEAFEAQIASALMSVHRNVRSVLAKESEREGDFRTRELRLIAGDPDTEVLHKESGCVFKLDPRRVYFSPRESAERERICNDVDDGESILVAFSGVGPFPICITKRRPSVKATAVELNPYAHNYCVENIHLNKVEDRVTPILGDMRDVGPRLGARFDRVLMPLPKGGHMFLGVTMPLVRDGGVLHFYHWAREPDLYSNAEELVKTTAESLGNHVEILKRVRVSQFSPRVWKVRVDGRIGRL